MEIDNWINQIIKGSGGFESWESHEFVIHHSSREESIAAFVIRCLANPGCRGSGDVLRAIINQRVSITGVPERWPSVIEEPTKSETI